MAYVVIIQPNGTDLVLTYNGPHNLNQLLSDIRDVKSRVEI